MATKVMELFDDGCRVSKANRWSSGGFHGFLTVAKRQGCFSPPKTCGVPLHG